MDTVKHNILKEVLNCPKCGKGELIFHGLMHNRFFVHTCSCGHYENIDTIYPKFTYQPEVYPTYTWTQEGSYPTPKKKKESKK